MGPWSIFVPNVFDCSGWRLSRRAFSVMRPFCSVLFCSDLAEISEMTVRLNVFYVVLMCYSVLCTFDCYSIYRTPCLLVFSSLLCGC